MRNKRVYQSYGIEKVSEDVDEIQSKEISDLIEDDTTWRFIEHDWVDCSTGELLTGYSPNSEFKKLVKSISNK